MPRLALALWLVYGLVTLVLRVALQLRRTGKTGLLLMRGRPGSVQWLGEALELVAIGLGVAAPVLALSGTVEPLAALDAKGFYAAGVALYALGLTGIVVAQEEMGASWRIGQAADERTELVMSGPFEFVRNPIFVSLAAVQTGLALLVPSVVALAGVVLQLLSIQIQVRLVEEPHLRRVHGRVYAAYAGRVGRFLPGIGRLRPPASSER
jgi:protein-S-isoprenylcysteine O-methyltransferase Ste14